MIDDIKSEITFRTTEVELVPGESFSVRHKGVTTHVCLSEQDFNAICAYIEDLEERLEAIKEKIRSLH